MYQQTLEQIVNSNAIKYDRLSKLIDWHYKGSEEGIVNLFIDLGYIIKSIGKSLEVIDQYNYISCILNLCGHYRNFFKSRYGVYTRIYILSPENMDCIDNKLFAAGYSYWDMSKCSSKVLDTINVHCTMLLAVICNYIEDITFIPYQNIEFGVMVTDIVNYNITNGLGGTNIIITKDIYNYQLVDDNNTILRPLKRNGEDESYLINRLNCIQWFLHNRKVSQRQWYLQNDLLSFILACTRTPERNIRNILKIPTMLTALEDAISKNEIVNGYQNDIKYSVSVLNNRLVTKLDPVITESLFNAIDIKIQFLRYINSPNVKRFNGILNQYNPAELQNVNETYFKKFPIIFENLQ